MREGGSFYSTSLKKEGGHTISALCCFKGVPLRKVMTAYAGIILLSTNKLPVQAGAASG